MPYLRSFEVERASVNAETGEFRAVLFTDGEASDGHILNIEGGKIPERMPLFVNHRADPREQLGSLFFDRKTPHQVHVRGQVFLDGEGDQRAIRQDVMAKIAAGHVSRMSGRWDSDPASVKRRSDLPAEHPAHVNDKAKGAKRYGLYFEKWQAMEGSIVGLGADPAATMRFAEDESAPEVVRAFWRAQAEETPPPPEPEPTPEPMPPPDPNPVVRMSDLTGLVTDLAGIIQEQFDAIEKRRVETEKPPPPDPIPDPTPPPPAEAALQERIAALEQELAALSSRVATRTEPAPVLRTMTEAIHYLEARTARDREQTMGAIRAMVDRQRGKVTEANGYRAAMRAEAENLARTLYAEPVAPSSTEVETLVSKLSDALEDARVKARDTLAAAALASRAEEK